MSRPITAPADMRRLPVRPAATLRIALTLASAAVWLAGCSSSPPTRYHPLAAVGASATVAYDGAPIEVGAVQIPPAMARQELVRDTGAGPFQVREFDHWAAPLGRLARQALAEDFAARLPPGKIVFPGATWPQAGAVLSVDVLSFAVRDGSATMVLSWSLRQVAPVGDAASPPVRGAQLRLATPAGEGAEATAGAWSVLLGQLSDRVAADLAGAPAR